MIWHLIYTFGSICSTLFHELLAFEWITCVISACYSYSTSSGSLHCIGGYNNRHKLSITHKSSSIYLLDRTKMKTCDRNCKMQRTAFPKNRSAQMYRQTVQWSLDQMQKWQCKQDKSCGQPVKSIETNVQVILMSTVFWVTLHSSSLTSLSSLHSLR